VKVGAFVVLVGFLTVGFMTFFAGAATVNTPEDAARTARNVLIVQGFGWIVVGIGFFTAFLGVVKSDYAIDSKIETVLERLPKK
jgi:hypothetical protein